MPPRAPVSIPEIPVLSDSESEDEEITGSERAMNFLRSSNSRAITLRGQIDAVRRDLRSALADVDHYEGPARDANKEAIDAVISYKKMKDSGTVKKELLEGFKRLCGDKKVEADRQKNLLDSAEDRVTRCEAQLRDAFQQADSLAAQARRSTSHRPYVPTVTTAIAIGSDSKRPRAGTGESNTGESSPTKKTRSALDSTGLDANLDLKTMIPAGAIKSAKPCGMCVKGG